MRPLTLRSGLVLVAVAALLPIGTLSVVQALTTLRYSRTLISHQLVTSALATARRGRDPLIITRGLVLELGGNGLLGAGGEPCRMILQDSLERSRGLHNLVRTDARGEVKCSALRYDPGTSFATAGWWRRGIEAGRFTVTALMIGPISKKPVLIAMQPVIIGNGVRDGAVLAGIDAAWLEKLLVGSKDSPDAVIAIIDGAGTVVLTNEKRSLPRFDVKAGNARVAEATAPDGEAWMYAVAPIYHGELYVVYAEPSRLLMATAVDQVRINLLLPIFALLFASVAIWFGTNHLVLRWLESLRALAAQFSRGQFTGDPANYARAPREIGLLSADLHAMARVIEARDHDLQVALDAKTALTHDIHHRVKNNLQIVSSLLSLQAGTISDPAAREALGQTRARIGALAQIHRLLYEESHDSDHGNVNIASLLNALCGLLRTLHRGQSHIHLSCDVASQTVPVNNAVPLSLLAVEAITNAYRHAFTTGESGTIRMHFDQSDDQATLSITDDGNGFDSVLQTASTGRQLMAAFAQQLGGDLIITSAPTGTVVTLTYPLCSLSAPMGQI